MFVKHYYQINHIQSYIKVRELKYSFLFNKQFPLYVWISKEAFRCLMAWHQRWKRLNWVHSNLKGTAPPPPCFKPFLCRSLDIVLGYKRGNVKGARMWIFHHFMLICNTSNLYFMDPFWKVCNSYSEWRWNICRRSPVGGTKAERCGSF